MSPIMGNIVNVFVYARLAPGIRDERKKKNPVTEKGCREHQHFPYLTENLGHPALTRHLYELIGMVRAFGVGDWPKFYDLVNCTYPKVNVLLLLPFDQDGVGTT
jgi:hypothetical protein